MLIVSHRVNHHCGLRFDNHLAACPLLLIFPALLLRLSYWLAGDNLVDFQKIKGIFLIKADIAVAHQIHFEILLTLEVIW